MKHIRLALSGGGHRATVFSLGALLYLVDSSRNRDVQTITSVSGGSLTNAYLSLLATPFNKMSANEFRKHAASFSNQIAGSPVMWKLAWVTYLLPWTIWLVPVPVWIRFAVFTALICIWAFQIGPRSRGTLWGWSGTWLYLGLLVIPAIVAIPVSWGILHQGWRILTIDIALIAGVLLALSRRHMVAGMAFGATVHSADANAQRHLSDGFSTGVRHVFCATEAHVGRHIFFSRDFVFTPDFGLGVPGPLRLCDAVQLSANFPGGFPFRRLPAKPFQFFSVTVKSPPSKSLVMTDGGVYDNSATSWYRDLEIPFQIRQLQEIDKFSRQAIDNAQRAMTAASQFEAKATSVLSECDPAGQELIKQGIKRVKELETQIDVGRLKKQVLTNPPEVVQSLLDELEDTSYDLIAVNAAYPPKCQHADLVARPVLSDMFIFTKCTETLYNNANHHRLRELRRVFLNKQMTGALVSFEENPEQLALCLADPQQWLLGKVPEEQDQLLRYFYDPTTWSDEEPSEDGIGDMRSRVAKIKSFYTRLEYSPDNISIPAAITNRAWEVIEQFHPGYQKAALPSADELRKLKELCDTRERLQQEVKARETVRDAIKDQLVGAQDVRGAFNLLREKNLEVQEAKRPLSDTESQLRELAMAVFQRRFTADLDTLPVILGLNAIRTKNQNVATTLRPLGLEKTANLLYQGYLCAMMNLHVLLDGYPLMPLPEVQDFKDLASGRWETWGSRQPATTKSEGAAF